MKKIIFLSLISLFTIDLIAQSKLGHINAQEILIQMPQFKAAEKELQEYAQGLENRLAEMTAEFQQMYQDYQKNQESYSDLVRQDKALELEALEERILSFRQNAQQLVQQKEVDLIEPINTKLLNAIQEVANEGKYTYILTAEVFLFADESQDIGALVRKKLGL